VDPREGSSEDEKRAPLAQSPRPRGGCILS